MKQAYNFFTCLISLVAGIMLQFIAPLSFFQLNIIFIANCIFSTFLLLTSSDKKLHIAAAITTSLAFGSLIFALHIELFKQKQATLSGHYNYLVGIVGNKQEIQHPLYQEYLTITLEGGKIAKFFTGQRLHADIGVYTKTKTNSNIGDKILLKKASIKPATKKFTTNDLFLAKQGIAATTFLANKYQYCILEKEVENLRAVLWIWRQKIYANLTEKLRPLHKTYVGLLFFGNKQHDLTNKLQDNFAIWGLSHYLARSGLHIVLLILMWLTILRFIPCNLRIKNIFLSTFILIYTFCSWESTSFLRALFIFLLAQGGIWLDREVKTLHLLTFVCMGMILYNPFLIFYLDFQLTFGLTFGLLIFSKYLTA
ncbi:ComEC/Rec2 family competence protein [Candidatus Dependentiae bacterium]|nr:ComEC/Rec2 family competence protein [Candidatus Dependentiae bacterium]